MIQFQLAYLCGLRVWVTLNSRFGVVLAVHTCLCLAFPFHLASLATPLLPQRRPDWTSGPCRLNGLPSSALPHPFTTEIFPLSSTYSPYCTHSYFYLFPKYLLSTYYMPGIVLDAAIEQLAKHTLASLLNYLPIVCLSER